MTGGMERCPYFSDFARHHWGRGFEQGFAEAKARTMADSVMVVLDARGMRVSAVDRQRIGSCRDIGQLVVWLERAATVDGAEELFD